MTIAQMQAHRTVLAGLLAETEASYANLSGLFAGAFPATETHLDARRAALRWALACADHQPTSRATGYPVAALHGTQAPCPVCDRPGWTVVQDDGSTVTLHSEQSTADGEPLINDACWTSE